MNKISKSEKFKDNLSQNILRPACKILKFYYSVVSTAEITLLSCPCNIPSPLSQCCDSKQCFQCEFTSSHTMVTQINID